MGKSTTITFIGAGYLSRSIIAMLLKKKHRKIIVTQRNKKKLRDIQSKYPMIKIMDDNGLAAKGADVIILATQQDSFENISSEIRNTSKEKLIISLGPTFKIRKLEKLFGKRVAHVMGPIYPRSDIICFVMGKSCNDKDIKTIKYIFGNQIREIPEKEMPIASAYTVLRGTLNSLIAPIVQIGKENGMREEIAREIVGEMFKSLGEEVQEGINPNYKLEGASGGFNEKTFTLQLSKKLDSTKKKIKEEMDRLMKEFVKYHKK